MMSHRAFGQVAGQFGGDTPSQLDNRYGLWLRTINALDERTVKRTGGKQTIESYRSAYSNELWLTGTEAVEGGYADEAVKLKCDKTLAGTYDQIFPSFFGVEIVVTFDQCPFNTYPVGIAVKVPTSKGMMTDAQFLAEGGILGRGCSDMGYGYSGLCLVDSSYTAEKVQQVKAEFRKGQLQSRNKVVQDSW
jgi:hypothetical protein